jgi:nitroimidazol reductase NimA-like FMN-containing flavoprotein (pyridoxamine 5'-phosphate oxidase superfamily)
MSLWATAESARIAALAARDAYWRILERSHARINATGDRSLLPSVDAARRNMVDLNVEYVHARDAAVKSGEQHPEDM